MVKRSFIVIFGFLGVLLLLGMLVWYLAYGAGPNPPQTLTSQSIVKPVNVSWTNEGIVQVDAVSLDDAWVGLGYGMGRTRAWQLILWRQAALGSLSAWFGEDVVPADYLTIQLEIAEQAQRDYSELAPDQKKQLDRLTDGLNASLTANDLARGAPFLLLGIQPEPWEGWHSIAIERLFAWVAGRPFSSADTSFTAVSDRSLRDVLQVDGFNYNWVSSSFNDSTSFVSARFVTGRTASPFFVEAKINTPERHFVGLMVPGTVVTPLGFSSSPNSNSESLSWGFLLSGNARVTRERLRTDQFQVRYRRISTQQEEKLVAVVRSNSQMPLTSNSREAESGPVAVLNWSAFSTSTDIPVWLNLINGQVAEPSLFMADGIVVNNEQVLVTGSPFVQIQDSFGRTFIANSGVSDTPADRFSALPKEFSLNDLLTDSFNQTAVSINEDYLSFLPDSVQTSERLSEGKLYLSNWNFEYDASEIGASIFELMRRRNVRADSTLAFHLTNVLDEMSVTFGTDMSAWRWESVQDRLLRFPGTTAMPPDGGRPEVSFNAKFNPINVGGPGHPQTFVWGTAHEEGGLFLSSAWEGGIDYDQQELYFRRPRIDYSAFLGSFLSSKRPIELDRFSAGSFNNATSIIPELQKN